MAVDESIESIEVVGVETGCDDLGQCSKAKQSKADQSREEKTKALASESAASSGETFVDRHDTLET